MLKDGLNAAQVAAQMEQEERERREQARRIAAIRERAEWAELYHVYERCVGIAEKIWTAKLDKAAEQQQTLAEQMRDRTLGWARPAYWVDAQSSTMNTGIPVPLFTPRDRLQFVKECAVSLLISADRRNLTALYKDSNGEKELAPTQETAAREGPVEGASGADEAESVAPLALVPEADAGERIQEAPTPSL